MLYEDPPAACWPIVYSPDYNITFVGLEKLHPFDAGKWGKVINFLKEEKLIADDLIVQAREATDEDLLVVHTRRYLNKLKWSFVVATITEIPPVAFLPNFVVQRKVLKPLRTQTGGTIMAGKLAVDRGWAINVGGGFHHCSSDKGGGFCVYADITLAIKFLFERVQGVSKATIIDLDAHQGNGHERDFMDDHRVYIMDVYNRYIYPGDGFAKRAIKRKVELEWGTEDTEYLQKVHTHVEGALNELKPDIIVYNAGTDILDGDPLGGLAVSPQGIVKRDEVVFKAARRRRIPILMVTSGGYQKRTARIIADSILNLHSLGLIDKELAASGAGNPKFLDVNMVSQRCRVKHPRCVFWREKSPQIFFPEFCNTGLLSSVGPSLCYSRSRRQLEGWSRSQACGLGLASLQKTRSRSAEQIGPWNFSKDEFEP
ncbi:histone deacetylase 11 [Patagioenas fasciata monilis]|uniref:Histone deacetylase 11 n=1 Tax=Patagioenas fasciata monilis TaxID=372326 RepID=A0A1V4JIL5_PATFA|nr:histone deacetylase 11 [Patagioenas fasciata monilis]